MNYTNKDIIQKLHDLYFVQRKKYLIQNKGGNYVTIKKGEVSKNGKKQIGLTDYFFEKHLTGTFTLGAFSHHFTKFICFDVDFSDTRIAKQVAYMLSNTLCNLGILDHHISYSGSKGYHIEIFTKQLLSIDHSRKLFEKVIEESHVSDLFDKHNQVELRGLPTHGVKIPLGVHQKSGKYCGFCTVEKGLDYVMDAKESHIYLMNIKRIEVQKIYDILDVEDDLLVDGERIKDKTLIETEEAISQFTPLKHHKQGEEYSIDLAIERWSNGLIVQGMRHKTVFLLSMFMKYQGLNKEEAEIAMVEWMERQDKQKYTSSWEECIRDIQQCIKDVYSGKYTLSGSNKDITVSFEEVKWIMQHCKDKNAKIITYAFLIQSKRHADVNGQFWFTFANIAEATGVAVMTAKTQVNKLIAAGVIEAIERNRRQKGNGLKNLPNIYKMNYRATEKQKEEHQLYKVTESFDISHCLQFFYTDKQLRKELSRRQYESFFKVV